MNHQKVLTLLLIFIGFIFAFSVTGLGGQCSMDDLDKTNWITSDQFFLPDLPDSEDIPSFYYDPSSISPADRFVVVNGDEFQYENGESVKFWGTNIIADAAFMSHSEAEKTANRLAKLGFNLVAFHLINDTLTISSNSYEFNSSRLDQLDYFISKLKENGIYVILPLIEHYNFKEGDNVRDWETLNTGSSFHYNRRRRAIGIFNEQEDDANYNGVVWIQKQYAKNLLNHTNPYTGNEYANEPALLMMKINNEVSILNRWRNDMLNDGNVSGGSLTTYYSNLLDDKWNDWLTNKYGGQQGLVDAWGSSCVGNQTLGNISRFSYTKSPSCDTKYKDLGKFYLYLHEDYFSQMETTINNQPVTRTSKIPVTGMNNFYGMSDKIATFEGLSVMTQNVAWEHPPDWQNYNFLNTAMVNMNSESGTCSYPKDGACFGAWIETKNSIFRMNYSSSFQGKPFLVTEYSYPYPKEYIAEYPLIGAAYGSFQDWNGIIMHAYKGGEPGSFGDKYLHSRFNMFNNPVVMSQIPVASKVFREGYVSKAESFSEISYTKDGTLDMFLDFGKWNVTDLYEYLSAKNIDYYSVLENGIKNSLGGTNSAASLTATNPFVSSTGQLKWDMVKGSLSINTERAEAAIGFLNGNESFFSNHLDVLSFDASTDFATLGLSALDGLPLSNSGKLLLSATSRVLNSNMGVSDSSESSCSCYLSNFGGPPMLIQPVRGQITLNLPLATDISVYRLTGTGKIDQNHEIPVSRDGNQFTFEIGKNSRNDDTLWYGIEISKIEETEAKFRADKEGNVYADKSYYGEEFKTGGADVAETITVTETVEPGDVVILDPDNQKSYKKSRSPYSHLAAGIISTKPGLRLSDSTDSSKKQASMALIGTVPAKVSDESGAIKAGDLLTTSSRPGFLMKCADPKKCRGSVIVAKALEAMDGETDKINVLLVP